jgi:mortality factor 4-like protein 1
MNKVEVKLDIPEQLKGFLVDDWENVTKTQKVCALL